MKYETAIVRTWIAAKLQTPGSWPKECWDDHYRALQEFERLDLIKNAPGELNAWAKTWLDRDQWAQMKNALRARRRRARGAVVTIGISPNAHDILKTISERDGVTFSQAIEKHLDPLMP